MSYTNCSLNTNITVFNYFLSQKTDEQNQISDKLKIMKISVLPCGLKHTPFLSLSLSLSLSLYLSFSISSYRNILFHSPRISSHYFYFKTWPVISHLISESAQISDGDVITSPIRVLETNILFLYVMKRDRTCFLNPEKHQFAAIILYWSYAYLFFLTTSMV